MSNLTLDGSTRFIGTEFIKLEITGSSNLATQNYVKEQISTASITGGSVDLSNYVQKSGLTNQVITGNLTVSPSFQSPNISTQFLNLRDANTPFKINRNGAEIIDIIPDPLVASNNEIRFHYDLEQQAGTRIRNYTYDTAGDLDVNFKIFDDDYISLKKVPLETVIFFKDINVSGNTNMEGVLTAKQGVIIPTGGLLSTDSILNVSGNDINIRTTGSNGVVITADDVEKGRIDQSGITFSDTVSTPLLLTSGIDTPVASDFLYNVDGVNFMRLKPTQSDIFFNKILTSFFDITTTQRVITNTADSLGDATLTMRRNNVDMITFQNDNTITLNRNCNFSATGQALGFPNFSITQPFSPTTPFLHIAGATDDGTIRFIVGNASPYRVLELNLNTVDFRRPLRLTTINNNPEFSTGIVIDATTNVSLRSAGVEYLRLDNGRDDMVASKNLTCVGKFQGNTYNTNGDSNMVFERNGVEYFRLENFNSTYPLLNFTPLTAQAGISAEWIYANAFATRSFNQDTVYYGGNTAGDGRVEIFRYDRSGEQLDFNTIINNSGRTIVGNLQDTIVSDERLKTDIEEYTEECSNCVKNVKLHKFKYKDEKYKNNDNYGFIAQELLFALNSDLKGIVREVKDKDSQETFLTINYMKLPLILWKALQEEMTRTTEMNKQIEHLESSVYELQEEVKGLKGKAKAKAKSKIKI